VGCLRGRAKPLKKSKFSSARRCFIARPARSRSAMKGAVSMRV